VNYAAKKFVSLSGRKLAPHQVSRASTQGEPEHEHTLRRSSSFLCENSSMASQPNITLPQSLLAAVREEADRRHKDVNELAGELIMDSLSRQRKSALEELQEYGEQQAMKKFGKVPDEEQVVDIVHQRRGR
jgi:hypothetical protein